MIKLKNLIREILKETMFPKSFNRHNLGSCMSAAAHATFYLLEKGRRDFKIVEGFVSLYMGIWLVTLGIGGKIAGLLANNISITENIHQSKINMAHGLIEFIILSIIGSLICFIVRKRIINSTKLISK